MGRFVDLTGNRYGRLTVVRRSGTRDGHVVWECVCDCGNTVDVIGNLLKCGKTQSCGCYKRERTGDAHRTHGQSKSNLHVAWQHMKQRCSNPKNKKYCYYGGRGISVCPEWEDYEPFKEWAIKNGYKDGLTLDRIDVNGNYEPSNCRWVTWKVQQNNKRNNTIICASGERHTLSAWEDITGICRSTIQKRIKQQGMTPEMALQLV